MLNALLHKTLNNTVIHKGLAAFLLTTLISGCGSDSKTAPESQSKQGVVNFVLASVDGASCSLLDPQSNMATIAGPSTTTEGVAIFEDVDPSTGLTLVECSGGSYVDEATGESMTPSVLRAYVDINTSEFTATVTPLTELTTRIVQGFDLSHEEYPAIQNNIAYSFGLEGVDLSTVVPLDLNVDEMDGTEKGNYGLVLAALSQLQNDYEDASAEDIIDILFNGMANNGLFTNDQVRDYYFDALENMFDNPRIEPYLGDDNDLDKFFHDVVLAPYASQVEYVDAYHPESHNLDALTVIDAYETSTFEVVGTHLSLKMKVTLSGEECITYDLQALTETNTDSTFNMLKADCPEQVVGEADLVVSDNGRVENTTTMTVVEPGSYDYSGTSSEEITPNLSVPSKYQRDSVSASKTGTSYVIGVVTAQAPKINDSVSAAHDYTSSTLEIFNVAGVTVDLVDENKSVIATTVTRADGKYVFENVPESTKVSVVVKAELKKIRATKGVGAEYNFSVRDNTSTSTPRTLYQVVLPEFTTLAAAGGINRHDVTAEIGFDTNGNALSDEQRQSAPFAILRIMKAAADAMEQVNANVSLPNLNVYWSPKNIAADGDKKLGQISTSHYAGEGLMPGLYILGKADSDTDEFDQGVIGHELGHYLQDKLSYSDNPGGNHSSKEFKDASLAYGEGYGTAIGGLLSGSQYYCDVAGSKQTGGFCMNLKDKNLAGDVKGFYSENSIITLMYGIGTISGKGLPEFFDAMTKMKSGVHSATIFPFLNNYLASNPDVSAQVNTLMVESNIKTSDSFGFLPAGTDADPAISANKNKLNATVGADDLEALYLNLDLATVAAPNSSQSPALLTTSAPSFCVNHNLPGANSANGLGMARRFKLTANYTGYMLIRGENKLAQKLSEQNTYFFMRDDSGNKTPIYNYKGTDADKYFGMAWVEAGKTYSLKLRFYNPQAILNGSQCGYKVLLARPSA